jgi:hypothetical protein
VVQVEVADDDGVNRGGVLPAARHEREVREAAVVAVAHVHAAVQHDRLAAEVDQHAAAAHVLAGAQHQQLELRHG